MVSVPATAAGSALRLFAHLFVLFATTANGHPTGYLFCPPGDMVSGFGVEVGDPGRSTATSSSPGSKEVSVSRSVSLRAARSLLCQTLTRTLSFSLPQGGREITRGLYLHAPATPTSLPQPGGPHVTTFHTEPAPFTFNLIDAGGQAQSSYGADREGQREKGFSTGRPSLSH